MRAGIERMQWRKFEYVRRGAANTAMTRWRGSTSSHRMRSCNSASRLPTQRWMPKPNDKCWRGRGRSMMKLSGSSIASGSRLPETYHMTTLSPARMYWPPSSVSCVGRAKPLVSYRVIVELISATTTKTGLTVRCELDTGQYPNGIVVLDAEMAAINIKPAEFHGEWNYTISPNYHAPNRAFVS